MYAKTSPPIFFALASLSVINPSDVDTIAIPSPLRTLGISSALAYTRNPGLLILLRPLITLSLDFEYLRFTIKDR